ncbi:MAG: hypothetical protein U1E70_22560 [Acetobacteraceae bacterium]
MVDVMGLGLVALGGGLLWSANRKYRERTTTRLKPGEVRPEFAVAGEIMRPIILFIVGFFALKMTLFYFALGGNRMLSALQYGGLMFVLGAYAVSLYAATAKRPDQAPANANASPAEPATADPSAEDLRPAT